MNKQFKKIIIMFVMVLALMGIGAIQNGTIANAATVGEQLLQPEDGWRRYDDMDNKITYSSKLSNKSGSWFSNSSNVMWCYNTTITDCEYGINTENEYFAFNFYGSKLRIISPYWWSCTTSVDVYIDDKLIDNFSENGTSEKFQTIVYEINGLNLSEHSVKIINKDNSGAYFLIDAIDIDENGALLTYNEDIKNQSILLDKSSLSLKEGSSDKLTATTTPSAVDITWSSSDASIATVNSNGNVTGIKEGQVTITAKIKGTDIKATCNVTVTKKEEVKPDEPVITSDKILNVDPEKDRMKLKEAVTANIVIDNVKEIAAEDMLIKYDSTKLKFLGSEEVDGIKLVKGTDNNGEIRIIVASKGVANIANDKKILLKLNFQGIAPGEALVDITKGKISDGIEMEKDLTKDQCGETKIIIEDETFLDVNNDGVFTLLDLAIDARHYGENPSSLPQYNTDIVINQAIDNDDLLKIGGYMLANPDYKLK